jgi:uncharacterized protein (TIGR00645 family)
VQKLLQAVPQLFQLDSIHTILTALTLVDLSLVANLVVIVIFAGWENFVGPLLHGVGDAETGWMSKLDFSALKLRLFASAAAIAGVQILETFMHIDEVAKQDAAWQLAILMGIGATGVMLAVADRLAERG